MNISTSLLKAPLFIDGEFVESRGDRTLPVTNPATQQLLANVTFATADEVERAVASAKKAFVSWSRSAPG